MGFEIGDLFLTFAKILLNNCTNWQQIELDNSYS